MSSDSAKDTIDVNINVYDLLPPGRLSSFLWTIGNGLLHSGVQIEDREYAFGGHTKPGVSGVYWTQPFLQPPGATFRCQIKHGTTSRSIDEVHDIIVEASQSFLGPSWNLLSNNCNHFTLHVCQLLTGNQAPPWLNRVASIASALPCVLPNDWLVPPDAATAEGALLEGDVVLGEYTALLENAQHEPTGDGNVHEHTLDNEDAHSINSSYIDHDSSERILLANEQNPVSIIDVP